MRIILYIMLILLTSEISAQSTIENILGEIAKNNTTIHASTNYWESQRLNFKTGLNPSDPKVEYDYLSGSPAEAGAQHDFTVVQSLDFPTTYFKRKQLVNTQIGRIEYELIAVRQNILLDAKLTCIELTYRNRLQLQLELRMQNAERLLQNFQTKLDRGEGNILEVNKVRIQLLEIKNEYQENISRTNQLTAKLASLNGGNTIAFKDTMYFVELELPPFEQLQTDYEAADPIRSILEQEKQVAEKQIELSKSLWLPKLELGYLYQGILGQTYNGIHTGISIPLWENKNSVKSYKSNLSYLNMEVQNHRNEHYYEIKQQYEKYQNLKITLSEYQNIFQTSNSSNLLDKALELGEISTTEYFLEKSYFYNAYNNYLKSEMEFYKVVSELNKYKL